MKTNYQSGVNFGALIDSQKNLNLKHYRCDQIFCYVLVLMQPFFMFQNNLLERIQSEISNSNGFIALQD